MVTEKPNSNNIHKQPIVVIKGYKKWFGVCETSKDFGSLFKVGMLAMTRCILDTFQLLAELNEEEIQQDENHTKLKRLERQLSLAPPGVIVSLAAQSFIDHDKGIAAKDPQYFIDHKKKLEQYEPTEEDIENLAQFDEGMKDPDDDFYTALGNLFEEGYETLIETKDPRGALAIERLWTFSRLILFTTIKMRDAGVSFDFKKAKLGGAFM